MKVSSRFAARTGSKHNTIVTEQTKKQLNNQNQSANQTNSSSSLFDSNSSSNSATKISPSGTTASTSTTGQALTAAQLAAQAAQAAQDEKERLLRFFHEKYGENYGELLADILRMYVRLFSPGFFTDLHSVVLDFLLEKEFIVENEIFDTFFPPNPNDTKHSSSFPGLGKKTLLRNTLNQLRAANLISSTTRTEVSKVNKALEKQNIEILGSNYDKFERQKQKNEITIWFIDYKTAIDSIVYKLDQIEQEAKKKQFTTFTIEYVCKTCKKKFTPAHFKNLQMGSDGESFICDNCGTGRVVEDENTSAAFKNNTQLYTQFCEQFKPILELISCISAADLVIMAKLEPIPSTGSFQARENSVWEEKHRSRDLIVTRERAQQQDIELSKENKINLQYDTSRSSKNDSGFGKSKEQEVEIYNLKRKNNPNDPNAQQNAQNPANKPQSHELPAWLDPKRRRMNYYGMGDQKPTDGADGTNQTERVKEEKVMGIEDEDDYLQIQAFQQQQQKAASYVQVKNEKNLNASNTNSTSSSIIPDYGITYDDDEIINNNNVNEDSNSYGQQMDGNMNFDQNNYIPAFQQNFNPYQQNYSEFNQLQMFNQQQQFIPEEVMVKVQGEMKRLSEITEEMTNLMDDAEYTDYVAKLNEAQQ